MKYEATKNLIDYGLTIDSILEIDDEKLYELIKKVNFNRKKVKTIKNITKILKENHNSKVPSTLKE